MQSEQLSSVRRLGVHGTCDLINPWHHLRKMSSWVGNPGRPPYVIPHGSAGFKKMSISFHQSCVVSCPLWISHGKGHPTSSGGGALKGSNFPTRRVPLVLRHTRWLILAQSKCKILCVSVKYFVIHHRFTVYNMSDDNNHFLVVNGEWSEWTSVAEEGCPVTCGGATIAQNRACSNPTPKYGGNNAH